MSKNSTSEADIIFNRTNVALARSQRLIASWLPPRTEDELRNAKSAEEIEKEEAEIFVPMPDLLGLGAKVPEDGEVRRQELSSNDKLRRQLLGKDMAKLYGKSGGTGKLGTGAMSMGSKPRPTPIRRAVEDDEEEGRSSLGKSKRKKTIENRESAMQDYNAEAKAVTKSRMSKDASRRSKKSGNSYLDEVLAEQQRRKQKRKRKREKGA